MATLSSKIAMATSLPAFLVGTTIASAKAGKLPTQEEVGRALVTNEYLTCSDTYEVGVRAGNRGAGMSHCHEIERPTSVSFKQLLCVIYGSDIDKNSIVRCVFKGQTRIYPNPIGYRIEEQKNGTLKATPQKNYPPRSYSDGTIDLISTEGRWGPDFRPTPIIEID